MEHTPVGKGSNSLLEEIRSQDIYTVHTPDACVSLPAAVTRSIFSSCPIQNESLAKEFSDKSAVINLTTDTEAVYVRYNASIEEGDLKLAVNRQPKLKKLSIGRYQNLPAVIEEDIDICAFSERRIHNNSQKVESGAPSLTTEMSAARSEEDIYYYIRNTEDDEDDSSIECLDDEESWVDLSKHTRTPPHTPSFLSQSTSAMSNQPTSPDRVTPLPFGNGEEYLRLLREAQKESNQSSARVSLASSRKDTPRDSPKSPPNSPNTDMALEPEEPQMKGVYINYYNRDGDFIRVEKNTETDWIWDWSSRPDQTPPKEWHFVHPRKVITAGRGASIRKLMVGNASIFSRDVLYTLLITNVLSLLLGTGIGIWLSKRSGGTVTVSAVPIN